MVILISFLITGCSLQTVQSQGDVILANETSEQRVEWKEYTSQNVGVSFKYPSSFQITESQSSVNIQFVVREATALKIEKKQIESNSFEEEVNTEYDALFDVSLTSALQPCDVLESQGLCYTYAGESIHDYYFAEVSPGFLHKITVNESELTNEEALVTVPLIIKSLQKVN